MANMGFDLLWIKIDVQARAPRRGARSNLSLHSTPDLAKQAAASTPPCGRRSSGSGLPSFRWLGPEPYADFADRNVLTIIIIEEKRAVEKIDEIASTPGIDVLFIGANDLSYSYGKRGNQEDPEVKEAIAKVLAAGKKYGVPVGRPSGSAEQMAQFVKAGFQFIQGPSDLNMLGGGAAPLLKALGKEGIDPKKAPLY